MNRYPAAAMVRIVASWVSGTSPSARDIADWCAKHLAAMKVPRYVLFMDELPKTPTHKILKTALRADPTLKARATDLSKA